MKRRSFKLKCCKFDYDSLRRLTPYINKHPDQDVCQINSVNLNLTASINYKAQSLEYIGLSLYALSVVTC